MDPTELAAETDGWRNGSHGDGIAKVGNRAKLGSDRPSGLQSGVISRRFGWCWANLRTLQCKELIDAMWPRASHLIYGAQLGEMVFSQRPSKSRFPHSFLRSRLRTKRQVPK